MVGKLTITSRAEIVAGETKGAGAMMGNSEAIDVGRDDVKLGDRVVAVG